MFYIKCKAGDWFFVDGATPFVAVWVDENECLTVFDK